MAAQACYETCQLYAVHIQGVQSSRFDRTLRLSVSLLWQIITRVMRHVTVGLKHNDCQKAQTRPSINHTEHTPPIASAIRGKGILRRRSQTHPGPNREAFDRVRTRNHVMMYQGSRLSGTSGPTLYQSLLSSPKFRLHTFVIAGEAHRVRCFRLAEDCKVLTLRCSVPSFN